MTDEAWLLLKAWQDGQITADRAVRDGLFDGPHGQVLMRGVLALPAWTDDQRIALLRATAHKHTRLFRSAHRLAWRHGSPAVRHVAAQTLGNVWPAWAINHRVLDTRIHYPLNRISNCPTPDLSTALVALSAACRSIQLGHLAFGLYWPEELTVPPVVLALLHAALQGRSYPRARWHLIVEAIRAAPGPCLAVFVRQARHGRETRAMCEYLYQAALEALPGARAALVRLADEAPPRVRRMAQSRLSKLDNPP